MIIKKPQHKLTHQSSVCVFIAGINWSRLSVNEVNAHIYVTYTCNPCSSAEGLHISTYFMYLCDHHTSAGNWNGTFSRNWWKCGSLVHATLRRKGDSFTSNHTSVWSIVHFKFQCTSLSLIYYELYYFIYCCNDTFIATSILLFISPLNCVHLQYSMHI